MKAQRKSLIGFMNRHQGPANASSICFTYSYVAQHALPIHQYNNQNIHLGWEDATYVRAIGGYVKHSVDPNVIFTSVKSRVNDAVGGVPVQRTIKHNTFVAIKNIVMGEEITINKDHLVPGGIFENDNTLHDGSGFYTHTYRTRPQKHARGAGPTEALGVMI